ncbi:MAG: GAF domain-containing protein [Deltaproteobacteria bacterium]|nr:GAF domain-containing protein [Deltaproteobacteria bacterium]
MSDKQTPASADRFLELFEEGKRFTQELLKENEKLRFIIAKLRDEKTDLEQQLQVNNNPTLAEKTQNLENIVTQLRDELEIIRKQFNSVEGENRKFAERYLRLERQNSDLLSMYVATYRLHSTLDFSEVVNTVKEIIINLIGSEAFGIYLFDENQQNLTLIASEGLEKHKNNETLELDNNITKIALTRKIWVTPAEKVTKTQTEQPIAAIPLKIDQRTIGVIALFSLLSQKDAFGSVDYELFELLGGHAATALYVANLYALSERKRNTLEGFIGLLKS